MPSQDASTLVLIPPYQEADVPAVAIFNNTESFQPYLSRAEDPSLFPLMFDKGNRALLWLGDPKLVVLSAPAPHLLYVREQVGYPGTTCVIPRNPSPWLCRDVMGDPDLLARLVSYAGSGRRLQLFPYVTTRELLDLADVLRGRYGLDVLLPESPTRENLWVRDYLDSKAGFRQLVGSWLSRDVLPEGFVLADLGSAAEAVAWFNQRGRAAIVKASRSNGGFGHLTFDPTEPVSSQDVLRRLESNPFLRDDAVIVEERIESPDRCFPAVEVYVPDAGAPLVTHVCTELFLYGKVTGQIVTPGLADARWFAPLTHAARRIGTELQRLGYRGIFDVDGVVDSSNRLYLLEINTRRTAGTHAHEFACFAFGADYAERMTVICHNTVPAGRVRSSQALLARLDDLLYRHRGPDEGIVITHTACLRDGEYGCIVVSPSLARATTLQDEMLARVARA